MPGYADGTFSGYGYICGPTGPAPYSGGYGPAMYLLPQSVGQDSPVYSDRTGTCRQVSAPTAGVPVGNII
jgi:hypothetical protein